MSRKNPFRVGVNHEAAVPTGVKQHAVRRLRPDAIDGQQPLANDTSFAGKKLSQITAEFPDQRMQKCTQPPRLNVEISGGPYQFRQLRLRQHKQLLRFKHARVFEIGDGALDI